MAEDEPTQEQLEAIAAENEEADVVCYKPPAQKTLQEIQELDKDDESLRKYKESLLGCPPPQNDSDASNVTVTRLVLLCESAPHPLGFELQGDLEKLKEESIVLKEGVEYRIKINFKVNKEIVSGLRYIQQTTRKGVRVDYSKYMVGSYGPRDNEYEYLTPLEEAPKGCLARGTYVIKSKFTDDDDSDHLSWTWNLKITKDWN